MDTPHDTPQPDPPPPVISDEEVDRLLRQAETLAQTIVEEVGVEMTTVRPHAAQFGGPEPNPLSAVELVAHDLAELKATIEEVSPEIQKAIAEAVRESDRKAPRVEEVSPAARVDVKTENPQPTPSTPASVEKAGDEKKPPAGAVAGDPDASRPGDVAHGGEPNPVIDASPGGSSPPKRTRSFVVAVAMFIPNTLMNIFVMLDRPFAGMSASAKNLIGAVGLASMVMGAAALFMPRIIQSNPYASMEPLPHPVATEGHDEHGGGGHEGSHDEAAKESHEEAPKEAHEEKPVEHGGGHH